MKREIIYTEDGSSSLKLTELNEPYHSIHGALQESKLLFIEYGLKYIIEKFANQTLTIFEMGMGTGLNVLLTALNSKNFNIDYTTCELYPLSDDEFANQNYCKLLPDEDCKTIYEKIHFAKWNCKTSILPNFSLEKWQEDLLNFKHEKQYQLIYFDAFSPDVQPALWTEQVFATLYENISNGGALVTYSCKGSVRRALQAVGFTVEKLPGPKGKKEVLRAVKI